MLQQRQLLLLLLLLLLASSKHASKVRHILVGQQLLVLSIQSEMAVWVTSTCPCTAVFL